MGKTTVDQKQVHQLGRALAKKVSVTPTPPKDDQGAKDLAAAMAEFEALAVQVAPAFEAPMVAAQNLEKRLAGR